MIGVLLLVTLAQPAPDPPRKALLNKPPQRVRRVVRRVGRRPLKVINLVNLHTRETLPVLAGTTPSEAMVSRFLRCRWTGKKTRLDPKLMRWVLETARHFGATEVQVISGYRHPKFNEMLRKKGRQVARRSNHRLGKAIDFLLKGVDVMRVYRHLKRRKLGGLGRYRHSGFLHLDTGRVRTWGGR